MAAALKPGAPLAFTYHHNKQEAYLAAGMAILDAGLTCTASLPCPAEMGGSIHISGTGSSIVDTVFVCRRDGVVPARWIFKNVPDFGDHHAQRANAVEQRWHEANCGRYSLHRLRTHHTDGNHESSRRLGCVSANKHKTRCNQGCDGCDCVAR